MKDTTDNKRKIAAKTTFEITVNSIISFFIKKKKNKVLNLDDYIKNKKKWGIEYELSYN